MAHQTPVPRSAPSQAPTSNQGPNQVPATAHRHLPQPVSPAAAFTFKAGLACFAVSWFLPAIHAGTSGLDAFLKSFHQGMLGRDRVDAEHAATPIVTPIGEIDPNSLALGWFEHAWLANLVVLAVIVHVICKRRAAIGRLLFPVSALGALWAASGYAVWHLAGHPAELTPATGAYLWAGSLALLAMSGCANRRHAMSADAHSARSQARRNARQAAQKAIGRAANHAAGRAASQAANQPAVQSAIQASRRMTTSSGRTRREIWGPSSAFAR